MRTPDKQPVAADTNYVDVTYLSRNRENVEVTSCAVLLEDRSFTATCRRLMGEGIFRGKVFIPPGAIIKVAQRD